MAIKRVLKINNSWPELFNFLKLILNRHCLVLLRTAPLPIHIVQVASILQSHTY